MMGKLSNMKTKAKEKDLNERCVFEGHLPKGINANLGNRCSCSK